MVSRLEALVDALGRLNGMADPKSEAYKLRNPLMLKAFSPSHARNGEGYRVFRTFPSGYDNAVNDLRLKCSGRNKKISPQETTLRDLVCFFGNQPCATRSVKNFLIEALQDSQISESTKLEWFVQEELTGANNGF